MSENDAAVRILSAAVSGEGIQGAARAAYELTGLPVSVLDPLLRPLAFYGPDVRPEDCRRFDSGPDDRKRWMDTMRRSGGPRIDSEGGGPYRALCVDACAGKKALAKVAFFETRPFQENDENVIRVFADVVACLLQGKRENADAAQETETPEEHLFEDRSGYDYFNALFFHRHKRLMLTPVRLKCKISGAVLVLTGGLFLALRVYLGHARFVSEVSGPVWRCYGLFLASLVFIMYCIGSGNSLTMAMFYNCDVSMLRYSFYRTPQAILQNFRIRMRYIIRNNGVVSLVMAAGIFLNCCVLGLSGHVLETLLLTATALMLSVFYSAVSLCMYYLFQPYLEDGKMTGIGYKVMGGIIYVFSYGCFQVRTTSILFPVVILIVTVVGLVSSYLLVYKVAPKTFHLK